MNDSNDLISRSALLENYGLKDAVKYGNKTAEQQHNSYSTLMLYEVADMIEEAPAVDAAPKWISVEDRLPEDDARYLCYTIDALCEVCIYYGDGEWIAPDFANWTRYVTHWMPLPEPPKMQIRK